MNEPAPTPGETADDKPEPATRELAGSISAIERLEQRAASTRGRNLWVSVSRVGTLGWLIALPIVGGALLGHLIDLRLGTRMTFTLALLLLGLLLAGYALWRHTRELTD
jgi:ATP synthase protein I